MWLNFSDKGVHEVSYLFLSRMPSFLLSLYSLTFPSEGSVRIVDCFVCDLIPMCSL